MAGLGRIQQKFNAAVVSILALAGLHNMAGGKAVTAAEAARKGYGHPIHAKYLHTQNIAKATGRNLRRYAGYCSGLDYRNRVGATLLRAKD